MEQITVSNTMILDIYKKQCDLLEKELNKLPELIEAILAEYGDKE